MRPHQIASGGQPQPGAAHAAGGRKGDEQRSQGGFRDAWSGITDVDHRLSRRLPHRDPNFAAGGQGFQRIFS